ncbi:MAG: hypothetical protein QXD70_02375, partial [Candidatus Bathyarchaeia archaeon]
MLQNTLIKPAPSKPLLTLNLPNIDQWFPGFAAGDFALIHGSHAATSLASLLCVRAQLPMQLGGLQSNVVFIDGGNTFPLYQIAQLARIHQLDPRQALERIYISRAFTAHQMTTLILEKLEEAISRYNAKLAIISDIAAPFLDKDIPEEEARETFSQVAAYLANFSRKNETILITTYPPHQQTRRNSYLHAIAHSRANIAISLTQTKHKRELMLEKHPRYTPGT